MGNIIRANILTGSGKEIFRCAAAADKIDQLVAFIFQKAIAAIFGCSLKDEIHKLLPTNLNRYAVSKPRLPTRAFE